MSNATEMLDLYLNAEKAVLKGQSCRLGERQLTRADLPEIIKGRQEWERRVAAESYGGGSSGGVAYANFNDCRARVPFRRSGC